MKTKTLNIGLTFAALIVLAVVSVQPARGQTIVTNFAVPSGAWGKSTTAVNPALNKVYLSGGASSVEQIVVVDGVTYAQTSVGNGMGADVDVTNNNYWSGGTYSFNVTVWNSANTALTSPSTGGACTFSLSVDAPHRRVWTAGQCTDSIYCFNADTYALVNGPISPGGVEGSIMVNPVTGRAYFNASSVAKRVSSTFVVTATAFGTVIGVNTASNLLYAANGATLQIINGAPDPEVVLTNVTLPFSFGNSVIGVNPALNRIYVGYAGTNLVGILNATTGQSITNLSLNAGVTSVAQIVADASRNRAYVMAYKGSSAYLYVIQDTAPLPALDIAPYGNQSAIFWPASAMNAVLQMTTNLTTPVWVNVSNGAPIIGVTLTNNLPAAFFRLH